MSFFYYFDRYKISIWSRLLLLLNNNKYKTYLSKYKYAFNEKNGLEIGGPSRFFSSDIFPIYEWAGNVDGCNFSNNTIWEGNIINTEYNYHPDKIGKQYILDGSDLSEIKDEQYDFLLSSHNLEHIANPLKAIKEWVRVLKPGGYILLILPDKNYTFDRKRPYTTFEHIKLDLENNIGEDDLTHLPEILKLHDLTLDPGAGKDPEMFRKRSLDNFINRALHQHVFSQELLKKSIEHFNMKTVTQYFVPPYHQIILGKKND